MDEKMRYIRIIFLLAGVLKAQLLTLSAEFLGSQPLKARNGVEINADQLAFRFGFIGSTPPFPIQYGLFYRRLDISKLDLWNVQPDGDSVLASSLNFWGIGLGVRYLPQLPLFTLVGVDVRLHGSAEFGGGLVFEKGGDVDGFLDPHVTAGLAFAKENQITGPTVEFVYRPLVIRPLKHYLSPSWCIRAGVLIL